MLTVSKEFVNDLFIRMLIEYYNIPRLREKVYLFWKRYDKNFTQTDKRRIVILFTLWHKGCHEEVKNIIESL